MTLIPVSFAIIAMTIAGQPVWSAENFPGKGQVTIGTGPLPLFVHYLNGSGRKVKVSLRNLNFKLPVLASSSELAALAKSPCRIGDVVNIMHSSISAEASGLDAAGIGRFVWLIDGQFTSDGQKWQFNGTVSPKDDYYNFNKGKDSGREFWAEVSTRIGAAFPGKNFSVQIEGSLPVSIVGVCNLNSAGQAIV